MKMHAMPLSGLTVIETIPNQDARGRFERIFCEAECAVLRPNLHWSQINLSTTVHQGTIRGMHFQFPPAAEVKLIRCLRGRIFDVAVDIRQDSPTFLHWHGIELNETNALQYFLPEGFAHGFQTLSDNVQLLYLHTQPWSSEHEGGIRYNDPRLSITWPLPPVHVSEKDQKHPLLTEQFAGIRI